MKRATTRRILAARRVSWRFAKRRLAWAFQLCLESFRFFFSLFSFLNRKYPFRWYISGRVQVVIRSHEYVLSSFQTCFLCNGKGTIAKDLEKSSNDDLNSSVWTYERLLSRIDRLKNNIPIDGLPFLIGFHAILWLSEFVERRFIHLIYSDSILRIDQRGNGKAS